MDVHEKLALLADASQYDLSCACGSHDDDRRRRGADGLWVYPASLPRGGRSIMLKTLLSSTCVNDCRYCPLRRDQDVRRCTLTPDEVAKAFLEYVQRRNVFGLFLTSGVVRDADTTMDRMIAVARLLRYRHGYRGFLHLKIIPGASDAAIETALGLASAVSLNVEVPKGAALKAIAPQKDYVRDIVRPIQLISHLTSRGSRYARVKQTTQFIVGAATETDAEIVQATFGLYRRLHLERVYFSAYQRGLGDPALPGERSGGPARHDVLTREHRLYQTDFLIRKYRWAPEDILFEADGSLSLAVDPKQRWADRHPEFFPVRALRADREALLRVPGLGPTTVARLIETRRQTVVRSLRDVGVRGRRLAKAETYVVME